MRLAGQVLVIASQLLLGLNPEQACAFERSRSEEGIALWWDKRQVTVSLNERCSEDVEGVFCQASVWNGLATWNEPSCSDFVFLSGGVTPRDDVGYDRYHPDDNLNLVVWVESGWTELHPTSDQFAVALTTTTFNTKTGEIYDSDVEFNSDQFRFFSQYENPHDPPPRDAFGIQSVLTHESGHILGLADLYDPSDFASLMYFQTSPGDWRKFELTKDDLEGLCTIYPREPDNNGLSEDPVIIGGCSTAPGSAHLCLALVLLVGLIVRARSKTSHRRG